MKVIGGFFELELSKRYNIQNERINLWCGRASFHVILEEIKPTRVYIPFYVCNSILEPLQKLNIKYEFYEINEYFYPKNSFDLLEKEYILYIDYFGIHTSNVEKLLSIYKEKLILDNTQAFFSEIYPQNWAFNSLRKFFGVADGSFLFPPKDITFKNEIKDNRDTKIEHLINRLIGNQQLSYQQYQENENIFNTQKLSMSEFSKKIFDSIDLENVKKQRKDNFEYLHKYLEKYNEIKNIEKLREQIPFCYPFLSKKIKRIDLIQQNIFVPMLWGDVLTRKEQGFNFEREISEYLLPLPIDQRYSIVEMDFILKNIINL